MSGDRLDVELVADDLRDAALGQVLRAANGFPGTVSVSMPAALAVTLWEAVTAIATLHDDAGRLYAAVEISDELRALVRAIKGGG